jgi:hypothetical protein
VLNRMDSTSGSTQQQDHAMSEMDDARERLLVEPCLTNAE